jgi:hypothetical protein
VTGVQTCALPIFPKRLADRLLFLEVSPFISLNMVRFLCSYQLLLIFAGFLAGSTFLF